MHRFAIVTLCLALQAEAPPVAPAWLAPYPGVTASTRVFDGLTESSYTAPASPDEVSAHFKTLFAGAGLAFTPNSDGIGLSIRGAAPECDLLITIRQQSSGTAVRVNCAVKSAARSVDSGTGVIGIRGSAPARPGRNLDNTPPAPDRGASQRGAADQYAKIAAEGERFKREAAERSAGFEAERKAFRANLDARMRSFDQPAKYRDDAPPLAWPRWLLAAGGARLSAPTSGGYSKHEKYLAAKFTTTMPMTSLVKFYENLLNANGYRVRRSEIATGSTSDGVSQNASGAVSGERTTESGAGSKVSASFSRMYLNESITVSLSITVHPSFGH